MNWYSSLCSWSCVVLNFLSLCVVWLAFSVCVVCVNCVCVYNTFSEPYCCCIAVSTLVSSSSCYTLLADVSHSQLSTLLTTCAVPVSTAVDTAHCSICCIAVCTNKCTDCTDHTHSFAASSAGGYNRDSPHLTPSLTRWPTHTSFSSGVSIQRVLITPLPIISNWGGGPLWVALLCWLTCWEVWVSMLTVSAFIVQHTAAIALMLVLTLCTAVCTQ